MIKPRAIRIMNQTDIYAARMHTREVARMLGFELAQQAQISLATSNVAQLLKMAGSDVASANWQITIRAIEQENPGVEVQFEGLFAENYDQIMAQLPRIQSIVDEFNMERLPGEMLRVIIKKWKYFASSAARRRWSSMQTGMLGGGNVASK